jgi:CRISPR-associated protein Cas2
MTRKRWRHIVVYDVVQDKRRNRVARILGGYGDRVQYSVFECLLRREQFDALWEEIEEVVKESEDSVRAYRLCAACGEWTKTVGRAAEVEVPEVYLA